MSNFYTLNQQKDTVGYNPDTDVLIRGWPRKKEYVREVEQRFGAKLLDDSEADLMYRLDRALDEARFVSGDYPDMLSLPDYMNELFMPVPFEINFFGMVIQSFKKPAWLRVKRGVVVPSAPWKK